MNGRVFGWNIIANLQNMKFLIPVDPDWAESVFLFLRSIAKSIIWRSLVIRAQDILNILDRYFVIRSLDERYFMISLNSYIVTAQTARKLELN